MIYCVKCGNGNENDMKFCQNCGTILANTQVSSYGSFSNPKKGKAIASMVLGIVSCALCWVYGILGLIPGIIGLVFANELKKDADAYSKNTGITNAGFICSLIGVIISSTIILLLLICLIIVFGIIGIAG